jgi:hypothetical protein
MQDQPDPSAILTSIADFLRSVVVPESRPHIAYQARVAANAVDLVRRQIELAPATDAAEQARLKSFLGREGGLDDLNTALAESLASGATALGAPGLSKHLWATTLAKLAVDQPTYSGYRAALASDVASKDA